MIEANIKVDDLEGNAFGCRLDDPDDWSGELKKDIIWNVLEKLKLALKKSND